VARGKGIFKVRWRRINELKLNWRSCEPWRSLLRVDRRRYHQGHTVLLILFGLCWTSFWASFYSKFETHLQFSLCLNYCRRLCDVNLSFLCMSFFW
jgi:hypothetical protein